VIGVDTGKKEQILSQRIKGEKMELEVTWKRAVKVWWSYLWRNIIAIIVAMIIGFIVGVIIGFVLGFLGASTQIIKVIVTPISMIFGLLISIVPIKMILGKDFGEFRLVLLQTDATGQSPNKTN
jgi:hypothetical protein